MSRWVSIKPRCSVAGLIAFIPAASFPPARPAQAQCQYEVTIIQAPDCPWPFPPAPTIGTGINDLGHVVGYYNHCGGYEGS